MAPGGTRADTTGLQRTKLAELLRVVRESNSFYRRKFAGIAFDSGSDPLGRLPLTTRSEIERDQADSAPYGTNLTYSIDRYTRLHQTSGTRSGQPLRWLDTPESWDWFKNCWRKIYAAAGVTPRDRIVFPFSFGPFIGFWGAFEAALDNGNFVLPAGGLSTAARLRYLLDNGATVVCCTPTYALSLAETAARQKLDLAASSVRALIVAGEPGGSIPSTRARIREAWGAHVFDHAGMTEIGAWGLECTDAPGGMHVIEEEFIAEVLDPQTQQTIDVAASEEDGATGELVLTNLGRFGSPIIRYRTGDQVQLVRTACGCGRTGLRAVGGVLGRIDDMLIIRGNNVFPSAIEDILRGITGVAEYRLIVEGAGPQNELTIEIEPVDAADGPALSRSASDAIRDRLNFRPAIRLVAAGTLPRFEHKAQRIVRD